MIAPKYKNYYLIFICSGYYTCYNEKDIRPNVYLKLSKKKIDSLKDIDNSEFITYLNIHWSLRYLPYNGKIKDEDLRKERDKVKLYPDDYYFLHEYQVHLFPSRRNNQIVRESQYYFFPNFKRPKDEFYHWENGIKNYFQGIILGNPWEFKLILAAYERNNLRRGVFYQLPKDEMVRCKDDLSPIYEKYYDSFIKDYDEDVVKWR